MRRTAAGATVDYVYDIAGRQAAEVNTSGAWTRAEVYAGGRHVATYAGGASGTTVFDHADWLGTERARSNVSGTMCETVASLPFGDGMTTSGSCGDPSPMHFTGKERDTESGLDYFGARYDSSRFGRFMSVDPSRLGSDVTDPQTLNRYVYSLNNPLAFIDPNGRWPTRIHNEIIDKAFPGLSAEARQVLKDASFSMDFCPTCQFNGNSYKHYMAAPGEDPIEAKARAEKFIALKEDEARADVATDFDPLISDQTAEQILGRSLEPFGKAGHTIMDGTSPAHVDGQGVPKVWNFFSAIMHKSYRRKHEAAEATITPGQMNEAVSRLRQAAKDTYGEAIERQMETPPSSSQTQKPAFNCTYSDGILTCTQE